MGAVPVDPKEQLEQRGGFMIEHLSQMGFIGMKIVDKWFYFQKFNVLFCLNTIVRFWEGQDVNCVGMMG